VEGRQICPRCGDPLSAGKIAELCPRCLLGFGMNDRGNTADTTPQAAPPVPERIGPYRILEPLGEGGMGTVYLAEQEEPVRRRVALKLIKWGMDTRQVVGRFESERQALALMDHPYIARVLDGGATTEGRPYFVMEYVRGEPITVYCDRQRLGTEERLKLFMAVCDAVQHAHQKGIIHRDLKPSNVLVSVLDGKPVPKIIDFGVARAVSQRLTEKSVYTQLGALIGTPEYMSPEQAEMTSVDIDTRTDVYSLGVMLYELLVGTLPFEPGALRQASFDEIRRRIREEEPSKPSARVSTLAGERSAAAARRRRTDSVALRKQLRGDLDWITMRALEKDRMRRYGSPADLAADLSRHLRHEPVLASPPSTIYRVQKFTRRHRLGVAAGVVTVAALIAGAGVAALGMLRAVRAEGEARREAASARRVSDFLVRLFEVSDPGEARGNTITARELLDRGAQRIDRELADQPLLHAQLTDTMGRVYRSLGLYTDAEPLLRDALEIRRRELGERSAESARSLSELAWLKFWAGQLDEAERLARQALGIQERVLAPDSLDTAWTRYRLGATLSRMGEFDRGRDLLTAALAVFERTLGPESQAVSWCLNDIGVGYVVSGQPEEGLPYVRRALEVKERVLGPDHPDAAVSRNNLADLLSLMGRDEEAQPLLEKGVVSMEKTLGPDHTSLADCLESLGRVLLHQGKLDEAEATLERALSIQESNMDPMSPELALTLHTLAETHRAQGEYEAAERYYRRALSIREIRAPNPRELTSTLEGLTSVLRVTGRPEEAAETEARVRAILEVD